MINVTKTYLPDKNKFITYIDDIFESGMLTNNGKYVKKLKSRLETYLGVRNLLLVSNGTLALQIAYKLLGLAGEVITTPFSFVATTSSIVWEGLKPIFVDIDKNTFCIDYKKIEDKITNDTSSIVPVHVFGNACEVEEIEKVAKKYNLKVIYDAAHAFGINYKGKSILNYGDISILSFHATKIFHTIEGGAIIIKDDNLYKRAERIINFGIEDTEKINDLGINAKMNEFQAAMGLCVLDEIDQVIDKRKVVYESYISNFKENKNIKLQKRNEYCTNNYCYFPILLDDEDTLLRTKKKLENKNIYPRRYFYPSLETLPYINDVHNVPLSNNISKRILCLPMSSYLNENDIYKIVSSVIM